MFIFVKGFVGGQPRCCAWSAGLHYMGDSKCDYGATLVV